MDLPERKRHFKKFMETEFSQDNITFYEIVDEYKQIKDPEARKEKSKEIFKNFIDTSLHTNQSVNLSSSIVEEIQKNLDDAQPELFNNAQTAIFKLMREPFHRFRFTDHFFNLLNENLKLFSIKFN